MTKTSTRTPARYQMDMCEGPILLKMLRFALPLMLSSILQLFFNAADIIVVGRFCGDLSLAAVGSNGSMVNLLTGLFLGMSVGSNVLTARFFSSGRDDELSDTVHTTISLALMCGVLLTFVGLIFAPKLLLLMATPENVLPLATLYLRIYFLGMTATTVYNFGASMLSAVGDTRRPLIILSIAGVVNVVLNVIFVVAFKLDVAGVAIATVISQFISASLVLICLSRETGGIRFEPKKLRVVPEKLLQIVRIGFPAGIQTTLFSLSNVIIQSSVNQFGEVVMAGNSAAANLEGFVYVAMNAFYQATVSFTSQNLARRKYKRIVRTQMTAQLCTFVTGLVLGWVLVLFGNKLLWIYSDSQAVVDAGRVRFTYIASIYFTCGIMDCLCGGLRGAGYSFVPMIVSLIGACGFRILWLATVFKIPKFHVIDTVYVSYPISWVITGAVHFLCFLFVLKKLKQKYPSDE